MSERTDRMPSWEKDSMVESQNNDISRLEEENNALREDVARLKAAMELYKQASYQGHTTHWDMTGGSGSGCPECIRARELRAQAEAALTQGKGGGNG